MQYMAFDVHKRYTWARVERPDGTVVREQKIVHERGAFRRFLADCEPGSSVAMETVGNWYWIADEIETAGCTPQLVHAYKAKLMAGRVNKTDRLDTQGLVRLQRAGTHQRHWRGFPDSRQDHGGRARRAFESLLLQKTRGPAWTAGPLA